MLHVQKKNCPVVRKCKQVCVSKLLNAKKEVIGTYLFFSLFYVSNRHEHVLWKTSMTYKTYQLFMLYVDNGLNNNKHILHKASVFVHAHVDSNIKNLKSINLRYL